MNTEVEKMKENVGALLQQEKGQADAEKGTDNNKSSDDSGGGDAGKRNDGDQGTQLSDREQWEMDKAIRSGWKPPEDFKGDPKDHISPKQWNLNVAWQRRLDATQQENKKLREQVNQFGDRVENVLKVAKATAIAELEAKKKDAVEEADHEKVKQIDKQIEETHKDFEIETPQQEAQPIRPEVQDWIEDNPWFENDQKMTDFAVRFQHGQLATLSDPNNPTSQELEEALRTTTEAVKSRFPDEFRRRPRAVSQTLESGSAQPAQKSFGYNDLTPQEKTVCDEMVRTKAMKREDYVQAIKDIRQQKGEL